MSTRKSSTNIDGWQNVLTGMGQYGKDRKEYTEFASEQRMSEITCRNLYTFSGLAKAIVDLPVGDGLRKWFVVEGDTDNLTKNECKRLSAKREFFRAWKYARTYGGSLMVLMANDSRLLDEPLDENNIQSIEKIKVFHRWRVSRLSYYLDKNDSKYAETEIYQVAPMQPFATSFKVHESRCIAFDGVDVAPEIRAGNDWWGDSTYQAIYQRLRGLGESYSNIEHVIGEFLLMVTKIKGLALKLATNKEQEIVQRAIVNNMTRHVMNSYMIDADGEDATRTSATTTGLGELIEKMMMSVSAETRIPIRRLFGTPINGAGLSNNGDAETRDYYDFVTAERSDKIEPQVERFVKLLMLQKQGPFRGSELKNWSVEWSSLYEEPMSVQLDNKKKQQEIDRGYWDMGVLDEQEIRDSRFGGESYSFDTVLNQEVAPVKEKDEV
jgi:phage-related protein (TIGR01555 family)